MLDNLDIEEILPFNIFLSIFLFSTNFFYFLFSYHLPLIYSKVYTFHPFRILSHHITSLLNEIFSVSTLILASQSYLSRHCQQDREKSTASVFDVSQVIAFSLLHSITFLATFSRTSIISLIELPKAIKPQFLIKERDIAKKLVSDTFLKISLMYIKKEQIIPKSLKEFRFRFLILDYSAHQ